MLHLLFVFCLLREEQSAPVIQKTEKEIVYDLFRLRNEQKADSAEMYFADTVQVYMKYLRNVPKQKITQSDKQFWKLHPRNRFEITEPVQITTKAGVTIATITGKEYLDGTSWQKEKIEIRFNRDKKIYYFRGFKLKNSG